MYGIYINPLKHSRSVDLKVRNWNVLRGEKIDDSKCKKGRVGEKIWIPTRPFWIYRLFSVAGLIKYKSARDCWRCISL